MSVELLRQSRAELERVAENLFRVEASLGRPAHAAAYLGRARAMIGAAEQAVARAIEIGVGPVIEARSGTDAGFARAERMR